MYPKQYSKILTKKFCDPHYFLAFIQHLKHSQLLSQSQWVSCTLLLLRWRFRVYVCFRGTTRCAMPRSLGLNSWLELLGLSRIWVRGWLDIGKWFELNRIWVGGWLDIGNGKWFELNSIRVGNWLDTGIRNGFEYIPTTDHTHSNKKYKHKIKTVKRRDQSKCGQRA